MSRSTATTPVGVATYDFFEDGLLKQTDYGNGLKETRTYDAAGRLETLSVDKVGQAVSRFEYGYDANGNRVSQVETRGLAGETTTYGYDEADRLIGVEYPAETHLYQVDAVGNRTGEKRAATGVVAALTVAAFAALSPAVASAAVERQHNAVDWVVGVTDVKAGTTTGLTYDANGNRTGEGTKAYRWDIRDTLTRVEDGSTVVGTYDYDAKLQRVKADTGQGHVEYVLDGKYVLREGGARSRRYHFGEGEALAVTGVGGTAGQDRWLLTDALGSVVTEADATATSVTARQFDAWGNYRNNTAPTANETRLGYTGHQFDVETGLTYARARYYDSKLGVFLSRDSFEGAIGEAPSLHRFTYAHVNPLKHRDPSGHVANLIAGAIGAGLGFAVGLGVSAAMQAYRGEDINWKKAVASGVGGAVSGGIAGLTMGGSLAVQLGVGAVAGGVAGSTTTRTLLGEKTTAADLRDDAVVSALTFGVFKGLGGVLARSSNGRMSVAIRELKAETADTVAAAMAVEDAVKAGRGAVVAEAADSSASVMTASDDAVEAASRRVSGAAQGWPDAIPEPQPNADGSKRTLDEAIEIARRNGAEIPEGLTSQPDAAVHDVKFVLSDYVQKGADAEYGPQFNLTGDNLRREVTWASLLDEDDFLRVRVRPEALTSDEKIVSALSHEMYEINRLRSRLFSPEGEPRSMTLRQYYDLVRPGNPCNLHCQAWDFAIRNVLKMRGGSGGTN